MHVNQYMMYEPTAAWKEDVNQAYIYSFVLACYALSVFNIMWVGHASQLIS